MCFFINRTTLKIFFSLLFFSTVLSQRYIGYGIEVVYWGRRGQPPPHTPMPNIALDLQQQLFNQPKWYGITHITSQLQFWRFAFKHYEPQRLWMGLGIDFPNITLFYRLKHSIAVGGGVGLSWNFIHALQTPFKTAPSSYYLITLLFGARNLGSDTYLNMLLSPYGWLALRFPIRINEKRYFIQLHYQHFTALWAVYYDWWGSIRQWGITLIKPLEKK